MGKEQLAKKVRDFQVKRQRTRRHHVKELLKRIDNNRRILQEEGK